MHKHFKNGKITKRKQIKKKAYNKRKKESSHHSNKARFINAWHG